MRIRTTNDVPNTREGAIWSYGRESLATSDGWRLSVHRLRPVRPSSEIPVVMVPGHATNAWTFLAGRGGGLAGALAAAGREVWVLDPRGSGDSHPCAGEGPVRIADKLRIDLPTFISHVRTASGSEQVDAVGHSLGGVLIYVFSLRPQSAHGWGPRSPIRRAVTLGSPLRISRAAVPLLLRTRAAEAVAQRLGRVRLTDLATKVNGRMRAGWMPIHFDPTNIDTEQFRNFLDCGVADTYGSELVELIRWVRQGCPSAFAGGPTLLRGHRLPMPTRFLVGVHDRLTTPEAVREAREALGGSQSDLVFLGKAYGNSSDYRHLDVLIGSRAHLDVAPRVVEWLSRCLPQVVESPLYHPLNARL